MARPSEYVTEIVDRLQALGPVRARSMFGGWGLSLDEVNFAIVASETLYFKVDDLTRPRYQALGLEPFKPFEDRESRMGYYPPPDDAFDDQDAFVSLAREAFEVGLRARAKRKPRKGKGRPAPVE